ncbi:carboxypeptidase-like regulatory domain-containing protein [Flavobacterium sp. 83]|uniref:carboxypeptidase-like regulatory domain-containing protein n=1 Tax=Flavobacterium sp. 83 TaxID=1131812 RepID=UPI0005540856|nr:carboxypeptidase-like regulatory domain-containing protein [Flavobacterium sp. 83]
MQKILFLLLFLSFSLFSQEIKLSGTAKDNYNRSIESASVVILDSTENTLTYSYTDENGNYSLLFIKPRNNKITITVSCLGYSKKEVQLDLTSEKSISQSFILEEKLESLKELVIEVNQKIKIDRDTTTIKVASFGNKTEQTLEDILKKMPGIEVQNDGSIKAHGKPIDKLLIEGEDLFDKNYKLLSKNLDAKVLDAVQIIDGFEDNPILKKLSNSDKVALNLKLKKDKQNIWFGNIMVGSGIVTENRWKEGINLGLLKKKIKLFYLADYNNSGEKATDQVSKAITENNLFGKDRLEKTVQNHYNISSNENSSFSKSQSVFNKALYNSLSFTKKLKPNITMRGVGYFASDNQKQNSLSKTIFNIGANPILNTETNLYQSKKILSSGELELKYFANEDNYLTNLLIYKNNPNSINADLIFNKSQIDQAYKDKKQTFYNHLNHSYRISDTKILNNYIYLGNDLINQKSKITSPFLNQFLNASPDALASQIAHNSILYFGIKSKLISRYRKLEYTIGLKYENSKEILNNNFIIENNHTIDYENHTTLKQNIFSVENAIRYNFSRKIDFTASLNYTQNRFDTNSTINNISIFNPKASLNIKKTSLGNFTFSYADNNNLPEINYLTTNSQLTDYRSFRKGKTYDGLLKNKVLSFSHTLFNDKKRFSISSYFFYLKSEKIFNSESTITNNFNFENYILTKGGDSYNENFNIVNYFRTIKLATKLETFQNWNTNPTKVNSSEFSSLKSYNSTYKFSGTTYLKLPINFDFGVNYNYFQSKFNGVLTKNETTDFFINSNYKISKTWLAEINSTYYQMNNNNNNYSFINAVINYNPEESRFSYRMILNNLTNENEFTLVSLDNYTSYKSTIKLVPRYFLFTAKYRF